MTLRWNGSNGPLPMAVSLANEAARLAKEGRLEESKRIFEKAFEKIIRHRGTLGRRKNALLERSELATIIADRVYEAGHGAESAMRMWKRGTNEEALRKEEKWKTCISYPAELIFLTKKKKEEARDEEVPPVSVQCSADEKEKGAISWLFEKIKKYFRIGLASCEQGEHANKH